MFLQGRDGCSVARHDHNESAEYYALGLLRVGPSPSGPQQALEEQTLSGDIAWQYFVRGIDDQYVVVRRQPIQIAQAVGEGVPVPAEVIGQPQTVVELLEDGVRVTHLTAIETRYVRPTSHGKQ
ncbi:hypothetical protein GCM10010377_82480 [Streptomyces viridiviolaceus]|nr:hypothetical protein GCM10010377_82480 [Streptomyces viridiviolaceus]